MEAAVIVAIIGGAITIIVTTLGKYFERRDQLHLEHDRLQSELRAKKMPVYSAVLNSIALMLGANKNKRKSSSVSGLTRDMTNWASTKVFILYLNFRVNLEGQEEASISELNKILADLVLAIREDLGQETPPPLDAKVRDAIGAIFIHDTYEIPPNNATGADSE